MNKKITKTGALALALLIGVGGTGIAYFTDYTSTNFTGKAGTIGVNNDIKANQDQLDILNPGDITPLEFKVKNTGNKLMRVKENISLSFWIPVRQLKEGVNINGRELRYDDFDLTEAKVLKDKDGNYVKAVPFEMKEENGELPFYITDENGNKITDYEITADERTKRALSENEIPLNEAIKQRYGIKDNKNELIPRKNKIKFNIPHYFILDGNKDLNPRETAENRKVQDITATKEDNKIKKYNLVFNKKAGNKYQDIIVEVKYDTEGTQWLNQYEDYTEKDFLKDDIQRLINQVTDKTKSKEFTDENNKLEDVDNLKELKKEVEDYLNSHFIEEDFVEEDFEWSDNTTITSLSEKGTEKVLNNGGHLVIPENAVKINDNAFDGEKYEDMKERYNEIQKMKEDASGYGDDPHFEEEIKWMEEDFLRQYPGFTEEWLNREDVKITSVDFSKADKLTTIGEYAFEDNQLTSLDLKGLPSLTTIGNGAFRENQIQSLDLKDLPSLTTIGEDAFLRNKLTSLELSNLPELATIGEDAFLRNQLTSLELSNLPKLTTIEDYAFRYNQIQSLDLRNLPNLTTIGKYAFGYNEIQSLNLNNLPELTTIGKYAFLNNQIQSLDLSDLPSLKTIERNAFQNNQIQSLDLSILPNLTTIGEFAFGNNKLTSLELSNLPNLTTIKYGAFDKNQLTSLDLSNLPNLTTIGEAAFYDNQIQDFTVNNIPRDVAIKGGPWGTFAGNPHPNDYYEQIIRNNPQN